MTSRLSSQTKRHLRHAGMATFALGFAALFGTNSAIADDGPNASPEIVYGSDSRREVYSLVPGRKQLAASTVALVTGDPSLAGKPVTLPLQPDLQTENKLCAGQRFAKQPVPAFCWLQSWMHWARHWLNLPARWWRLLPVRKCQPN